MHDRKWHEDVEASLLRVRLRRRRCRGCTVRNGGGEFKSRVGKQWSSRLSSKGNGWFIAADSPFGIGLGTLKAIPRTRSGCARAETMRSSIVAVQAPNG